MTEVLLNIPTAPLSNPVTRQRNVVYERTAADYAHRVAVSGHYGETVVARNS